LSPLKTIKVHQTCYEINLLNAQFESLSIKDPMVVHDSLWEDATNEWMTYQRELYSFYGFCYIFEELLVDEFQNIMIRLAEIMPL
jgi:hypothetical protein